MNYCYEHLSQGMHYPATIAQRLCFQLIITRLSKTTVMLSPGSQNQNCIVYTSQAVMAMCTISSLCKRQCIYDALQSEDVW